MPLHSLSFPVVILGVTYTFALRIDLSIDVLRGEVLYQSVHGRDDQRRTKGSPRATVSVTLSAPTECRRPAVVNSGHPGLPTGSKSHPLATFENSTCRYSGRRFLFAPFSLFFVDLG